MKSRHPDAAPATDEHTRAAMDALRRIVQALRVSSRSAEARLGLSSAQLFVLQCLADEAALSINELAARTVTHQSSVSTVVSRLVERGLAERRRSDVDARRVEIALTRDGRAILRRGATLRPAQSRLIEALAALSPRRKSALAAHLTLLADQLGPSEEAPVMLFEEDKPAARKEARRG